MKLTLSSFMIPSTSSARPLDQPLTLSSWPWMCSMGIAVLTELSLKTTLVFFHRHQARSPSSPDQPISRSPRARNGPPPSSRKSELRHQGGHLLAEIEVEPDLLDPGVVNAQIEPGRCLPGGRFRPRRSRETRGS